MIPEYFNVQSSCRATQLPDPKICRVCSQVVEESEVGPQLNPSKTPRDQAEGQIFVSIIG